MKWTALPIAALALFLGGCNGQNEVWMIFIPDLGAETCDTTINHNFNGATVIPGQIQQPGPWTYEQTRTGSENVWFVQIFTVGGGDEKRVMLIEDMVLFGTKEGGAWNFEWDSSDVRADKESHESGYVYENNTDQQTTTTINLDFGGAGATGTLAMTYNDSEVWNESDMWDPNLVGRGNSQIPADWYLEDANQNQIENFDDATDCASSPCNLEVIDSCSASTEITARRTNYDDRAYDSVSGVSQP